MKRRPVGPDCPVGHAGAFLLPSGNYYCCPCAGRTATATGVHNGIYTDAQIRAAQDAALKGARR